MDITKLPKWAQKHIEQLQRERDEAIVDKKKYMDEQSPSPFFTEEIMPGVTGFQRRYIQARRVTVICGPLELDVRPTEKDGIHLTWHHTKHGDACIQPMYINGIVLKTKEQMS